MSQALSLGDTLATKYAGSLGYTRVRMLPLPTQMLMCLLGRSGEGKSYFWQSCPVAYILNCDCASTSNYNLQAYIEPGLRSDGQPVVPDPEAPTLSDGRPDPELGLTFDMNWEWMLAKKQMLLDMAEEGWAARPKIVVIDTADIAYEMLKEWMVRQWNEEHDPKDSKQRFNQLYGGSAYPDSYVYLYNYGRDLRRAGYGVCWNWHLDDKIIYIDEMRKEWLRDVPRVPENCYQAIKGRAQITLQITLHEEEAFEEVPKLNSKGKPKIDATTKRPLMTKKSLGISRVAKLTADATRHRRITKQKIELPATMLLSRENPWADYEKFYFEASGLTPPEN